MLMPQLLVFWYMSVLLSSHAVLYVSDNLCSYEQVFHQDVLASLLAPESSQYAVRTALETFVAYRGQSGFPVLGDMFEDPLGLSEGLTSQCRF